MNRWKQSCANLWISEARAGPKLPWAMGLLKCEPPRADAILLSQRQSGTPHRMIPSPAQLQQVARMKEGSLEEIPFAVLLCALDQHGVTAVLEIRRAQLQKKILLEEGTPVDCRSNLLHETLGKFMVHKGRLSEEDYQRCLSESASTATLFGEVLMRHELITAFDFFRLLQQNLAHKLLDGFTWRQGTFHILPDVPHVESPLKVRVPQLVLTGLTRFAPQAAVDQHIAPLVGCPLALHPSPPVAPEALKLNAKSARVITQLKARPRLDQLAAESNIPFEELTRLLYALAVLGVVVPADTLPAAPPPVAAPPKTEAPAPPSFVIVTPAPQPVVTPAATPAAKPVNAAQVERIRNDVSRAFLAHRRQDAFELLGLDVKAGAVEIRSAYVAHAHKYAPWEFTGELAAMADKAQDLFFAGARAFAVLADSEQRNSLIFKKQKPPEKLTGNPTAYFAIKTDLLDANSQFQEGMRRMKVGSYKDAITFLEFAADCDPQNGTYRAELAWCRFRELPTSADKVLSDLLETQRMDPECGVAVYYTGELYRHMGSAAHAEAQFRKACKMLQGDRRPVDALKAVLTAR